MLAKLVLPDCCSINRITDNHVAMYIYISIVMDLSKQNTTKTMLKTFLLLMEEIHHLGCRKPCK